MMKKVIAPITVGISMLATNAIATAPCDMPPRSQEAINMCAEEHYKQEDTRLNKTYKELVDLLEKDRQEKLNESQLAWIKYRDLQCDLESSILKPSTYHFGSLYPMVLNSCLSRMTVQRNKDLEDMLEKTLLKRHIKVNP